MYSKILVPMDGSRCAETILPYVEALALRFDARLVLLTVIARVQTVIHPDAPIIEVDQHGVDLQIQEAESYLRSVHNSLAAKSISSRVLVELGPVVEAICRVANEEEADLIAMASHGRTGLKRVAYGSVATSILQRVDRPLLLIRAHDSAS